MAGYIGSRLSNSVVSLDGVTIGSATKLQPFIGSIAPFAMSSAPSGWLVCNGAAYAIADYGDLYAVITTTWGALQDDSGNAGTTHFVVPDLRGAFLRGTGTGTINTRNKAGGSVGDYQEDHFQGHGHKQRIFTGTAAYSSGHGDNQSFISSYNILEPVTIGTYTDARFGSETFPYNASIQYCIKF